MTKICCLSDTHTQHGLITVPKCDILIHAGDFTITGKEFEIINFLAWFGRQPAKYKILIAGNHDYTLDETHPRYREYIHTDFLRRCAQDGITYLEDSSCTVEGIKIHGTPWTRWFYDWGFNGGESDVMFQSTTPLRDKFKLIPPDTDILVSHGPAYDILDKNSQGDKCGSFELRKAIQQMSELKLVVCGHIHESRGYTIQDRPETFELVHCNVASVSLDHSKRNPVVIVEMDDDFIIQGVTGFQ